jgi:exodeoxyribonuclease V alpha subunit
VIVLKNNYKIGVRNGEIGVVIGGDNVAILIKFSEEKIIEFNYENSFLLSLAYAINVYKSQGSEFKNILILLFMEQYIKRLCILH